MDIEIGYYPESYYKSAPNAGGFFPFALEGDFSYVFSMALVEKEKNITNFITSWMMKFRDFPIYFCTEFAEYYRDEFELCCKESWVEYSYLSYGNKSSIAIAVIKNEEQLKSMIGFLSMLGSNNEIVLWSTNKNVFNVAKRAWSGNLKGKILDTIIVNIEDDTSVFWIGYDGASIDVISNKICFSAFEEIIQTLPNTINPIECEYGEE